MNWISFENKYFNYFKREYFSHMEQIIQQGDEIKKIFFIMSGQFEITTSLSIGEIYRIIKQKRNDALDNYNIRLNKNKYKIRLSICNNKDIVGLNDCCYNKNNGEEVSFVNVTCISSNSVVFTLDKNILNGLKNKISEINDNLIEIINRREKVVVDRLITNFNTLLKKREIDIKEKLGILTTTNKSMTSKKKLIIGKDSLVNKFKKENNEIIINGDKLPPNMRRLYSANYKQIRPLSKNSYINKKSSDETMIMNNSNRIKSTTMSSKNGISKLNSEKINLTNNYASLSINKDSNTMFKGNLQKQTSKIDEDNKGNINNIYPYINNMASNEYNKLSNFGENMNNISEKQKSNYMNEENRIKTEGYINNNKDGNKINKYQQTDSNKLFENESLSLINKDNIMIKNKISNKLSRKKNINFFTQDNNNIINEKFIKNTSLKSNNEENKINNNDYFVPTEKNRCKAKLISNESYLKQILGNRYRSEDDEFISIYLLILFKMVKLIR
jgi:CRP-like cAMP-binding protein